MAFRRARASRGRFRGGGLHDDESFHTGKVGGRLVNQVPGAAYTATYARDRGQFARPFDEIDSADLRRALLERGHQRFDIYCAVCHGRVGEGDGVVVRRGFRRPPSYHIERLRDAPVGHFYDVISNGFGAMPGFSNRVDVGDRWAIAAYIRVLQFSQNARLEDVPESWRRALEALPIDADDPRQHDRKATP